MTAHKSSSLPADTDRGLAGIARILAYGQHGLTLGGNPELDSRIMTDYDYLVSLLQGFTLAGAGLGLVTGLGCCIHWRVMRARDIKKLRNRTKAKPHTLTKF